MQHGLFLQSQGLRLPLKTPALNAACFNPFLFISELHQPFFLFKFFGQFMKSAALNSSRKLWLSKNTDLRFLRVKAGFPWFYPFYKSI